MYLPTDSINFILIIKLKGLFFKKKITYLFEMCGDEEVF